MKSEQGVIVAWMRAQANRLKESPTAWARRAGLNPTTVTRALGPDYPSVTSVPTLDALARAAGVPSVLQFLGAQAAAEQSPRAPRAVLAEILHAIGCAPPGISIDQVTEAMVNAQAAVIRSSHGVEYDREFIRETAQSAIQAAGIRVAG